jgi:hypothetical protein
MSPFIQNVLLTVLSALCGGCATVIAYAIKHSDEKKDNVRIDRIITNTDSLSNIETVTTLAQSIVGILE